MKAPYAETQNANSEQFGRHSQNNNTVNDTDKNASRCYLLHLSADQSFPQYWP